jgi:hypothetical protein
LNVDHGPPHLPQVLKKKGASHVPKIRAFRREPRERYDAHNLAPAGSAANEAMGPRGSLPDVLREIFRFVQEISPLLLLGLEVVSQKRLADHLLEQLPPSVSGTAMGIRPAVMCLALISVSCASIAPPFQVYGHKGDIEQLSGRWAGEYVGGAEHGRRGSISFDLAAGDDHAHGTVLMFTDGSRAPVRRFEPGGPGRSQALRDSSSNIDPLLTIRFAWVSNGVVEGVLDPYWDSDRGTAASTTFTGRVGRNSIDGTFTTQYADRAPSTGGTWSVSRR